MMAAVPDITFQVNPVAGAEPLPVVIVQDKKSLATLGASFVGHALGFFFSAWIIMLLVPVVFPDYPLSYWQAAALLLLGNGLVKTDIGSYIRLYTRSQ